MQGIIFVLHGRKKQRTTANQQLLETLGNSLALPFQITMLEGSEQTLEETIPLFLNKGITEIIFVPILLFPATHAKEDLPQRAKKIIGKQRPYRILPTLGTTEAIRSYLIQQITVSQYPEREVLLIAHGTPHYQTPYLQLNQLAQEIQQQTSRRIYAKQYLGEACYQTFLQQERPKPLVIQRLFLTEGHLAKKIKEEITSQRGTIDFFLPTLQDQPVLAQAIIERLEEVNVSYTT